MKHDSKKSSMEYMGNVSANSEPIGIEPNMSPLIICLVANTTANIDMTKSIN